MTSLRSLSFLGVVAVLLPAVAVAAPPKAETADATTLEARQWVKKGTEEYGKEHWEAAYEAFEKAWELKKHFAIAANLAESEMHLGRYLDAAEHWKFNLANLPPEKSDHRTDAEQRLEECRTHVTVVRARVSVDGASVALDGKPFGTSPLSEELWLTPGHHRLDAAREGFTATSLEFDSAEGETREVTLTLAPVPVRKLDAPEPEHAPPPPPPEPSVVPARTVVLLGGAALTLAAVGVGVGFTLSSNAATDDASSLRDQVRHDADPSAVATNSECAPSAAKRPAACDPLQSKLDDASRAHDFALASFIGAGVIGAATVTTFLLWPGDGGSGKEQPRLAVSAWDPGRGVGARLFGRF